ncbi:hypothetical protein BC828DRAFT_389271 [Blastocladiella britannica]|nr:hypothetical protein BC828DRAFT_389271 [Blastocladiella britannica]
MLLVDVTDHCVWTIVGVQRQRTELSVRPPERNLRHWCSTRPRSLFSSVRDEFFDDRIAGGMRNSGDTDSLGTPMAVRDRRHSISEPESVQGMVISGADTMAGPPAVPDDWDLRAPRSMVLVPAPRLDLHALPQLVNLPQFDSVSIAGIPDDAAFDYGHDERMSVHLSLVGKRFPVDDPEQMQLFLADIPVRLQMLSSTHAVAELPSARTVRSLVVITSGGGAYGSHGVTPTAATNGYAVSALDEQFNPAGSQVDVHYEHGDRVETVRARHSQFLATPAQLRAELSDEALETAALLAAQSSAPGSRHFITAANHRYVLRASERLLGMAVRFPGQLGMPIDDVSPLSAANGGTQSQQQQQLMPPPPLAPMHHVHHHQRPNQHLHPHRPAALDLNGLATSRGAYSAAPASYGGSPVESGPLSPLAGAGIGGGNSNAFASPLHSPPPLPGATTTWTQRRPLPPPTHGNTAGPFARYEPVPPPPVPPQQPELRRPPPVRVADLTTIAPLPASQLLPVEQIDGPVLKLPLMWARKDGLLVELGRTVVYSLALGEDDGLLQFV